MLEKKRMLSAGATIFGIVLGIVLLPEKAYADTALEYLRSESVGASIVFNTGAYNSAEIENLGIEIPEVEEIESMDLVMVCSTSVLNVRDVPDMDSTILGKLYNDCGGIVLERGDEWSYIQSGDVEGWAKSEYLLFDEEAIELAKKVGNMTATVIKPCVNVYAEAGEESLVVGYASYNSLYEVIYEVDENWLCIALDECDGFIKVENVDVEFNIDHGETMEAIAERKAKEEAEKRKLIRRNEAIEADGDTLKVLATIIWCEARGESYDGQLAVGSVVMNRVRSGRYPDTVYDVVFASGQFSPVKSGTFQKAYENNSANQNCYKAAQECLDGYTNVGDMTHFRRKGNKDGYIIGNHVFY